MDDSLYLAASALRIVVALDPEAVKRAVSLAHAADEAAQRHGGELTSVHTVACMGRGWPQACGRGACVSGGAPGDGAVRSTADAEPWHCLTDTRPRPPATPAHSLPCTESAFRRQRALCTLRVSEATDRGCHKVPAAPFTWPMFSCTEALSLAWMRRLVAELRRHREARAREAACAQSF